MMGTSTNMTEVISNDIESVRLLKADLLKQREQANIQIFKLDELIRTLSKQEEMLLKAKNTVDAGLWLVD